IDAILTMAESRGLLKILSRPRVVTQNNIQALVRQGVRVPIVTQAQLGGPPTVTYVDAFLRLTVVPQITSEGTIFLNVDVENTTPDFGHTIQGNPTLITQQATTQVLVTDGGTVVIGGVIQTQNSVNIAQVPLLGNIPAIGDLFKRRTVRTATQELIVLITPRTIQTESVFFSDGRYSAQAKAEVQGAKVMISRKAPILTAAEWMLRNRPKLGKSRIRVGIEGDHLSVAARTRLLNTLSSKFLLREAPPIIEQARMVKDAAEIELIRRAVRLGSSLFDRILETIRPGISEAEVAAELEYAARKSGADDMSFPTIIASGERSSLPHGRASQAAIPPQAFVVCDFGVILSGYC